MLSWAARGGSVASRVMDGGMAPVLPLRTGKEEA